MRRWLLAAAALGLSCLAVAAESRGWQASVELQPLGAAMALPEVLVPKQSLLLKVSVWMPPQVNWYPRYPAWDMPGATLLPLMMLSPSIARERDGLTQRGATQNYLLTPLAEGTLRLAPEAIKVYPDQADSPLLPIAPIELLVALPDAAGSIEQFLPASTLKVGQVFLLLDKDGQSNEVAPAALGQLQLQEGQMLERRISLEAEGIQGGQIPPLPVDAAALQHEAEAVDLNNYGDFTGGKRIEHWFYAPGAHERIELQPLSVRWYELGTQRFRTEQLPGGEIRAVALRQTDARLQLSWWERLTLLSWRQISGLLAAVALLAVAIHYRRAWLGMLARGAGRLRKRVGQAEAYLFLKLCSRIALFGPASSGTRQAFQRWSLRMSACQYLQGCAAIQRWQRSQFGARAEKGPWRWDVFAELRLLRRQLRHVSRMPPGNRYALPPLHQWDMPDGQRIRQLPI